MGEPKAGLNNAIVVGAVNLVLDPVLMFGCGLGVAGAAMATAAAQWVRPVLFFLFFLCLFVVAYFLSSVYTFPWSSPFRALHLWMYVLHLRCMYFCSLPDVSAGITHLGWL